MAAPIRFVNVILTLLFVASLQIMHTVRKSRGKRRMAGVVKRVALAVKEDAQKLGYKDAKPRKLEIITGILSGQEILVRTKQTCGLSWQLHN